MRSCSQCPTYLHFLFVLVEQAKVVSLKDLQPPQYLVKHQLAHCLFLQGGEGGEGEGGRGESHSEGKSKLYF